MVIFWQTTLLVASVGKQEFAKENVVVFYQIVEKMISEQKVMSQYDWSHILKTKGHLPFK